MHDNARLYAALVAHTAGPTEFTSEINAQTAAVRSLRKSLLKKLSPGAGDSGYCDERALRLFTSCNDRCRDYSLTPSRVFDDEIIGEVLRGFDRLAFDGPHFRFDSRLILQGAGLGPGMNVGVETENMYHKLFSAPLTMTSSGLFEELISSDAVDIRWHNALEYVAHHLGTRVVQGSNLSFVPKTMEISRVICTEPTLNMFYQKGISAIIEKALLREFRIDLSKQPDRNARMAWQGSIDGDFCTIDLKSASDTISLTLLRSLLPPYLLRWLMKTRSPQTKLPGGSWLGLDMVSSMGNGFTFSLQTYLFACIVKAVYRVMGLKTRYATSGPMDFGVFGDDIVVRREAYSRVVSFLELCGFEVNRDKSFNSGPFRESCGKDFFNGTDIRGVYLQELDHVLHLYSAIRRLDDFGNYHKVCWFTEPIVRTLRDALPPYFRGGASAPAATDGFGCLSHPGDHTGDSPLLRLCDEARKGHYRDSKGRSFFNLGGLSLCAKSLGRLVAFWRGFLSKGRDRVIYRAADKLCRDFRLPRVQVPPGYFPVIKYDNAMRKILHRDVFVNPWGAELCFLGGYITGAGRATLRRPRRTTKVVVVLERDYHHIRAQLVLDNGRWRLEIASEVPSCELA